MPLDTSPGSQLDLQESTSSTETRNTPGDGYGTATATAGTELLRVVPPFGKSRSRIDMFGVTNAAAATQTVTLMVPFDQVSVASEAAAAQAVVNVDRIPTAADGTILAANDFIVVKNEYEVFGAYKVASLSGLAITVTVSVGAAGASGFVKKVPKGAWLWFFGAPGDQSDRQYTIPATTPAGTINWAPSVPNGYCTTKKKYQPILVHMNNQTTASFLHGPAYSYPDL